MRRRWVMMASCLIVILGLMLTACDPDDAYSHYEHVPLEGWIKSDGIVFDIPALRRGGDYAVTMGLRTNAKYPFTSVSVIVDQTVYPSKRTLSDTIECKLADDNGRRLGPGINTYQYTFHVRDDQLATSDSLHVVVRHHMRSELLDGISDVGISLKRLR